MCQINEKITDRSIIRKGVTGYKAVFKRDGKYYSLSTGIEYKVGLVEQPTQDMIDQAVLHSGWQNPTSTFFRNTTMMELKLTGITKSLESLKTIMINSKNHHTFIKMTLRRNLHHSMFDFIGSYVGSYIVSLEEVKE